MLERIELAAAREWLGNWVRAGIAQTPAQLQLFRYLSPVHQWERIEAIARIKRRATETGALRRALLDLPDGIQHAASLVKQHNASAPVLKLLREVFSHRRHAPRFEELIR